MEPITLDELLKAVEAADDSGEGFTTAELRAVRPMGVEKARTMVKRAIALGIVRPGRKLIADMAGRMLPVASYVVVRKKSSGRRR